MTVLQRKIWMNGEVVFFLYRQTMRICDSCACADGGASSAPDLSFCRTNSFTSGFWTLLPFLSCLSCVSILRGGLCFVCFGFLVLFCNVIHETYFFRLEWLKTGRKMKVKKTFEYLYCSKYSNVVLPTKYHLRIVLKKPKVLNLSVKNHFKNLLYTGEH